MIEKGIEGGWKDSWYFSHTSGDEVVFGDTKKDSEDNPCYYKNIYELLLDPLFWQAVGKVEGWDYPSFPYCPNCTEFGGRSYDCPMKHCFCTNEAWQTYMHRMIDALADGKTLEEYIETL